MLLLCWFWTLTCRRHPWFAVVAVSLTFVAGISAVAELSVLRYESGICAPLSLLVTGKGEKTGDCSHTPLTNAFAASAYMNRCFEIGQGARSLPTGIMVQTLDFTGPYSFEASGYLGRASAAAPTPRSWAWNSPKASPRA